MAYLNLTSYYKIIQGCFVDKTKQREILLFLLSPIHEHGFIKTNEKLIPQWEDSAISRLLNYKLVVPTYIVKATAVEEIRDNYHALFADEFEAETHLDRKDDALFALNELIESDPTIKTNRKSELHELYDKNNESAFLAETFLYALSRDNKNKGEPPKPEDSRLLLEANFKCPLCHNNLVDTVDEKPVKLYEVVQIFPSELDQAKFDRFSEIKEPPRSLNSHANLIALDTSCAQRYHAEPTDEIYERLCIEKERLSKAYDAIASINKIELDDYIRKVLSAIIEYNDEEIAEKVDYNAFSINEKIEPSNHNLRHQVKDHVLSYYKYIESVFKEATDDFEAIATNIKSMYLRLAKDNLSQDEIVSLIACRMRDEAKLDENSDFASRVVVSFFIQNCEIFKEIPRE